MYEQKVSRRKAKREASRRRSRENKILFPPPLPSGEGPLTAEQIDAKHSHKGTRSFPAKYAGTCARCHEEIHPGQRVHYTGDELVHHRHDAPVRVEQVCERCHMVQPCDCDE